MDEIDIINFDKALDARLTGIIRESQQSKQCSKLTKSHDETNICKPSDKDQTKGTDKDQTRGTDVDQTKLLQGSTQPLRDGNMSSSDEEHSITEFLTEAADIKVKSLNKKCENLQKALVESHMKIKNLTIKVNEANVLSKDASRKIATLKRSLSLKEKALSKKDEQINGLLEETARGTKLNQSLTKENFSLKKELKEEERKKLSLQKEKEILKNSLNEKRKKFTEESDVVKEEKCRLQAKSTELENKNKELLRHISKLTMLTKKQDQLIQVLQKQKCNIATAKVTRYVEEELLALVERFGVSENGQ